MRPTNINSTLTQMAEHFGVNRSSLGVRLHIEGIKADGQVKSVSGQRCATWCPALVAQIQASLKARPIRAGRGRVKAKK